jgi:DNA-binding GntR family transcriptional regulator
MAKEDSALPKVRVQTLQNQVYEEIRSAIIRGDFAPGEPVTIRKLADQLGTSPMPVREAIHRLVSEHALEMRGPRSLRVSALSEEKFDDLIMVRSMIEPEAAAQAATSLTPRQLSQLERLNAQLLRCIDGGDVAGMLEANRTFHFTVYEAANSPMLLQIIDSLWLQSGPYLQQLFRTSKQQKEELGTENINLELLDAFAARNAKDARRIRRRDIRESAAWFKQHVGFD